MKITELIWLDNVIGRSNPNTTACQPMSRKSLPTSQRSKRCTEDISAEKMFIGHLGRQEPDVTEQVFFIHKRTNKALILSARDMDEKERKSYARK